MPRGRASKNHFVAALGEFVGTFLFLFFGFGGAQIANLSTSPSTADTGPNLQQLLYISLIFGFSLAINVWIFFRVSGGLFNPAVTLALCITGVVPILRSVFIFVSQMVGAIAAAAVIQGLTPGYEVVFGVKLAGGISIPQGLFLEMFLTAELVFTVLMLAAEKTKATFVAPVGIGLALFVAELVGVYWTGGALNPARAFGPAVVMRQFSGDHWIYWLGPMLGALLASAFYALIKYLKYEEVNGEQDKSEDEEKRVDTAERHKGEAGKASNQRTGPRGSHHSQRSQYSNRPASNQRSNQSTNHYQEYNGHKDYPPQN